MKCALCEKKEWYDGKDYTKSNRDIEKKYSDFYRTSFGSKILNEEISLLENELNNCTNILSVGCGSKIHEISLANNNPNMVITCIDNAKKMITENCNILPNMKTLLCTAEQLPLKNETFDCIYYLTSLEFIDDYKKAIKETARVLKTEGKVIFLTLNFQSEYFQKEYNEMNSYIKRKLEHKNITEIIRCISQHFNFITTAYVLGIKDGETFNTKDSRWASLYKIKATG